MRKRLDPSYWARALGQPLVLLGLLIDLLPVYGVLAWGWTAVPLVMLYWVESVIAGVMTLPRILASGANFGPLGAAAGALLSLFFVFHYGLFCLVHGTFLIAFASFADPGTMEAAPFMDFGGMIRFVLNSGLHVVWIVSATIAFQLLVFVWQFLMRGEWKTANPMAEMFAPYSHIVVLHIGIFAGAAALFLLGQPMLGVLALIVFRAVWGVLTNSRQFGMEAKLDQVATKLASSNQFEKLLRRKTSEL